VRDKLRRRANSIIRRFAPQRATTHRAPTLKFLIDNWFLVASALISGGMLLWPMLQRGAAGGINTMDAVMLVNRQKGVLIDVSEPAEYAAGHAGGARNVPLSKLETAADLPKNKALPLVVLCATGARSGKAVAILRKLGYENVRALSGGLRAWREANLPVEKSAA
jgi:rhodanese-related sulfurtransferase